MCTSPARKDSLISTLLAIAGPRTGMRLELGDRTIIGRAEEAGLCLEDASVSREHACIERRNLSWLIEDLSSRHGTYVNGERLAGRRVLLPNDEIRIGGSRFLFDSEIDIQNADFSDRTVYFAPAGEETVEVAPVAVLSGNEPVPSKPGAEEMDFIVRLGELFDPSSVSFSEALRRTCSRLGDLFCADELVLLLRDSATGSLRPAVVLSENEDLLADASLVNEVARDRKAFLLSDRPQKIPGVPHPPEARSVICTPLEVDEALVGVLYLQRRTMDAWTLLDLRNARAVSRLMAVFIEARQRAEALALRQRYRSTDTHIIGTSRALRQVLETAGRAAPTKASILITGETGTGKEMLAREVHRLSGAEERNAPFVAVNCSAIPETLFESQLFGHEKGAFTGAWRTQQGLIERANGGTIFLDEIGEMNPAVQPKLLRFLQERAFTRVGGTRPIRADVRLVCATNRDLENEVQEGRFRSDLYHRISVLPLHLPPLRERREDIGPLAEHFVRVHAESLGRPVAGISSEAIILLEKQQWHGNVRELSNTIERAVLLCEDRVLLPRHFQLAPAVATVSREPTPAPGHEGIPAGPEPLADVERRHIRRVLDFCEGNQVRAAEFLGIHRNTLRKKIQDYGLRP